MELDEVGKIRVIFGDIVVKVIMAIKAPRGMCQIFKDTKQCGNYERQAEAVRAFMEEHKNG